MEKKIEKTMLMEALKDFKELKNIDRNTLQAVLIDAFKAQLAKTYGTSDNFDVSLNMDNGDYQIMQNLEVVEEVEDPATQISLEEVNKDGDDFEIGDEYAKEISITSFGRRGVLNLKQTLQGRIMDLEKAQLLKKYEAKVGELFSGEVYQTWPKEVLILDEEGNELHLVKEEQIPNEHFRKKDSVKAIIKSVEMKNNTTPYIKLSRIDNAFLEKLFEQEVPEIYDGLITIKKVARVPGVRAKVAVESYDDRVDPIGACIGVRGTRIMGIVKELRNENIDVIQWTTNKQLMIQRALAPAKITKIVLGAEDERIKVYMPAEEEVKKGIGKGGCNIRLASMLVGKDIDLWRDNATEEDDILLDEFNDEIDQWIIDKLKEIGCDTARSVLALKPDDVALRADLEDETVEDIFRILKSEFED